jgi:hypothetical protein
MRTSVSLYHRHRFHAEIIRELIQLFKAAHEKEIGALNWKDLQLVVGGGGATLDPLFYWLYALHKVGASLSLVFITPRSAVQHFP